MVCYFGLLGLFALNETQSLGLLGFFRGLVLLGFRGSGFRV